MGNGEEDVALGKATDMVDGQNVETPSRVPPPPKKKTAPAYGGWIIPARRMLANWKDHHGAGAAGPGFEFGKMGNPFVSNKSNKNGKRVENGVEHAKIADTRGDFMGGNRGLNYSFRRGGGQRRGGGLHVASSSREQPDYRNNNPFSSLVEEHPDENNGASTPDSSLRDPGGRGKRIRTDSGSEFDSQGEVPETNETLLNPNSDIDLNKKDGIDSDMELEEMGAVNAS